ncbi:hypothetical protein [Streptomyces werraensis]
MARYLRAKAYHDTADFFTNVPEPLLIGATVDGHRYVRPEGVELLSSCR